MRCRPEPSYFGKAEAKKGPSKGMQLGKAKKGANDFLESLRAEGEVVDTNNGYAKDSGAAPAGGSLPGCDVLLANPARHLFPLHPFGFLHAEY